MNSTSNYINLSSMQVKYRLINERNKNKKRLGTGRKKLKHTLLLVYNICCILTTISLSIYIRPYKKACIILIKQCFSGEKRNYRDMFNTTSTRNSKTHSENYIQLINRLINPTTFSFFCLEWKGSIKSLWTKILRRRDPCSLLRALFIAARASIVEVIAPNRVDTTLYVVAAGVVC